MLLRWLKLTPLIYDVRQIAKWGQRGEVTTWSNYMIGNTNLFSTKLCNHWTEGSCSFSVYGKSFFFYNAVLFGNRDCWLKSVQFFFFSGQFRRTQTFQLAVLTIYSLRPLDKWKKLCAFVLKQCSRLKASAESFGEYNWRKSGKRKVKNAGCLFMCRKRSSQYRRSRQLFQTSWEIELV